MDPRRRRKSGLEHARSGGILFRARAEAFCTLSLWGHSSGTVDESKVL
jgi:hypothetical protein